MKSALFTIFAGAVCAAMTATATDATSVRVTLNAKGSSTKIEKLGMPQTFGFPGQGLTSQPITPWQVVNIPVQIEAKAKGDDSAHFVSQLTFKAHLLVEAGDKRVVLSKEITYVDIPLSGSGDVTKTEMSVGVFIPPSTAIRLNKKGKGDLKGKLLGVAIETEFNGIRKDGEDAIFDNSVKKNLKSEWWTRSKDNTFTVCSIDETPYAAWAGTFYPAVRQIDRDATSPITPAPTPADDSTTEGADTTTPTTTDTPAADAEEAEDTGRKGGKKNKNKKNKKR